MASRGINKVILIGNLGQDPEVRYSSSGSAIANISVATSETWKDKQTGEQKDKTEWHRVVIFGKLAEIAGEYLKKGSQIYIEGQLQTRKWQDQAGADRYATEVVVNQIGGSLQILGSRNNVGSSDDEAQSWGQSTNNTSSAPARQAPPAQAQQKAPEPPMDFDDDIPF